MIMEKRISIFGSSPHDADHDSCGCKTKELMPAVRKAVAAFPQDIATTSALATTRLMPLVAAIDDHNVVLLTRDMAAVRADWLLQAANMAIVPDRCDSVSDWTPVSSSAGAFSIDLDPTAPQSDGSTNLAPVVGRLIRLRFTPADELTIATVSIGTKAIAEVSGIVDSTSYVELFVPSIGIGNPLRFDGRTVYSNSPDVDAYGTAIIQISQDGTNSANAGSWRVDTRPVFLTNRFV